MDKSFFKGTSQKEIEFIKEGVNQLEESKR